MSSLSRPLTGPNLTFLLSEKVEELRADDAYVRSGRAGQTLAKDGPLRLTLLVLRDGAEVGTHHAESPMTLQCLSGTLCYRIDGESFEIGAGELLFFGGGQAQDIRAVDDTAILLTVTGGA